MALDFGSRLASTFVDSSTGINHIVWVDSQFIWHATYDNNSGTWQNAGTIAFIGNEKVKNLSLVGGDKLITTASGANTLPGMAVVWQQGEGNNTDLFYTAGKYDRTQNLQWFANPQQITQDEVEDSDPSVFLQDDELIIVSSKVNLDNVDNFSVKEDKDLYYQRFTISEDSFSSTPEVVINASYVPDTENNNAAFFIPDEPTQSNSTQNQNFETTSFSVTSDIDRDPSTNFVNGFIGSFSVGSQIQFSTPLPSLFPLPKVLKDYQVPETLLEDILGFFKVDGTISGSLYPDVFSQQGGIATGDGGEFLVKTSAKFGLGAEASQDKKRAGELGRLTEDIFERLKSLSKIKIGASVALENKNTFATNEGFPLKGIKDKITLTASVGYTFGFEPLTLTISAGVGGNFTIKVAPIEGESAGEVFGLITLLEGGIPLISVPHAVVNEVVGDKEALKS